MHFRGRQRGLLPRQSRPSKIQVTPLSLLLAPTSSRQTLHRSQVKLLEVKIDELSAEVQRARVREQELRKELLEAQQTSQAFESKAAAQAATARHTAAQRREALGEAEAAAVRLREEEMKLERELQARRQADEQAAFLVRENAKLKTALAELSISAERLASDNATAQQDNDNNKMVKVLSRWMIRKMRDKLTVTLVRARTPRRA